jgi:hypothetical protein
MNLNTDIKYRKESLKKLLHVITKYEEEIILCIMILKNLLLKPF